MKHTFKVLLSFSIFAAASSVLNAVQAQAKCKFVYEQKDPFKKITIYNSQQPIGPLLGGWTFILRQEGPKYMIGVGQQNGQNTTDKLPIGSKLAFMFGNGESYELVTTKEYESTPLQIGNNMFTQWVVCEEVSKETFTKFTVSPITALKSIFKFKGENREFVLPGIKDRQGSRIMETAVCMLQNN